MDEFLKWEKQNISVRKKLTSITHLFYHVRDMLTQETKKMLYHALAESRITYSLPIWGNRRRTYKEALQKKQNTILRILYGKRKDENIDYLYKQKNIKNINQLLVTKLSVLVWSIQAEGGNRGELVLNEKKRATNIILRESVTNRLLTPKWLTNIGKRSLSRQLPRIANHLEQAIRTTVTPGVYKYYPKRRITAYWLSVREDDLDQFIWET